MTNQFESVLDNSILSDDVNMDISGYNPVTAVHLANSKRGDGYIYFRKSVPLRILDIHFLHAGINLKMRSGNKICNFIFLYELPNQSLEEFETFADNLEFNLDTVAFLFVLLGDLNPKLRNWCKSEAHPMTTLKLVELNCNSECTI